MLTLNTRAYSTNLLLAPAYSIGFLLLLLVSTQWATGLLLACHYLPTEHLAWTLIGQSGRDLPTGYLTQSVHTSGATILFLVTYLHMGRALYRSSSQSNSRVWASGVIIYILLIGTCFTGYSLVYGQMSMWAIVVICSLVTAIPYIGKDLLQLIWGSSTVSTSTLGRLYTTHYLLAVVILLLTLLHLYLLHTTGSTGSHQSTTLPRSDRIDFLSAFVIRDLAAAVISLTVLGTLACWLPNLTAEADNSMPANPLVTPSCISPEWYMLPYYALIRAIPSKPMGILAMGISFMTLANLGDTGYRSWSSVSSRQASLLFLALTDLLVLSLSCLQVNTGETLYLLLTASALSLISATLTTDDTLSLPSGSQATSEVQQAE